MITVCRVASQAESNGEEGGSWPAQGSESGLLLRFQKVITIDGDSRSGHLTLEYQWLMIHTEALEGGSDPSIATRAWRCPGRRIHVVESTMTCVLHDFS